MEPDQRAEGARVSPYAITADALDSAARFVRAVNEAVASTGVSFDPSYGGVSVGHMLVGNLAWSADGIVLDVRHA